MIAKTFVLLATMASVVIAAPAPQVTADAVAAAAKCKPTSTTKAGTGPSTTKVGAVATPTLPSTGTGTQLPAPDAGLVLKAMAVGHGIQNYTCSSANATATATGAIAVLYDISQLYPGTPRTGLSEADFAGLSKQILYGQNLPINLQNRAAASPGTPARPNVLPEASYGAVVAKPFNLPPADAKMGALTLPALGVHYFDGASNPTFDLKAKKGFVASVKKVDVVVAPATAEKGILGTGAVQWLGLPKNDANLSVGNVTKVYRVVTAGGVAQACSVSGAGTGSVPYAAQYWFYGTA